MNQRPPGHWSDAAERIGRDPDPAEFVPPDFFRVLEKGDIFPDPARPLEIDIGCGDGGFLIELAATHPERDFLGVERLLGRLRKVCRKAQRRGLSNVKALRLESSYTVEWLLPPSAVRRAHLLFPDPWPKKRHAKRRLVTPAFADGIVRILEPDGEFLFKSDDAAYFDEAAAVIAGCPNLRQIDWPENAFPYPLTDFERQWRAAGRQIRRARFKRRHA